MNGTPYFFVDAYLALLLRSTLASSAVGTNIVNPILMDAICIIVSGLRDADTTRTQNDNNEEAAAAEAEFSTHRCHNLLLHHHLSSQR